MSAAALDSMDRVAWANHIKLFEELTDVMLRLDPGRDEPPASAMGRMATFMSDLKGVESALGVSSARAAAEAPEVRSRLLIEAARAAGSADPDMRARVLSLVPTSPTGLSSGQALSMRLSAELQMFNAAMTSVAEGKRDQFLQSSYSVLLWGATEANLVRGVHQVETATARLYDAVIRIYGPRLDDRGVQEVRSTCGEWAEAAAREIRTLRGIYGDAAVLAVIEGGRGASSLPAHLDLRARMAQLQAQELARIWRMSTGDPELSRGAERVLILPGYY